MSVDRTTVELAVYGRGDLKTQCRSFRVHIPSPSPCLTDLDIAVWRLYAVATLATTGSDFVKFTNVRELKTKTSEMLRTVERGNTVLITTHGRPTAMLVPVTEDDIEDALLADL